MFTEEQRQQINATVRTSQIIVAALVTGVLAFLGIVVALFSRGDGEPLITWIAIAVAIVTVFASIVVSRMVTRQGLQSTDLPSPSGVDDRFGVGTDDRVLSKVLAAYQTRLIVACAPLEGAAFFNLIAYMLEGQALSLIVAGMLMLLMAVRFPTTGGAEDWVANALRTGQGFPHGPE